MRWLLLLAVPAVLFAQGAHPRIGVAELSHESNSFNPKLTTFDDFAQRKLTPAADVVNDWARSKDPVSGFVLGARQHGLDLVPIFAAAATPKGPVSADAFERLTALLVSGLKSAPKLDGLLLSLHGALVSEKYPHGDVEIMKRVRQAVGPGLPIVVVQDFHANVAPELIRYCQTLITYKEVPHIDTQERGIQAAGVMAGIVSGKFKPVQAIAKPDMVYNILYHNTSVPPLKPIVDESRRLEKDPRFLAVSVPGGYQYADVEWMGPSVIVVTNNDQALAEREAQRLSKLLWETREQQKLNLPEPAEAVRRAMAVTKTPVVMVEMGDNIGGGSAGDATFLLSELVKQQARGWVVVIAEPALVKKAFSTGIGSAFDEMVGGKMDKLHGSPVRVKGRVRSLHDGAWYEPMARHGGRTFFNQGLTAVIEVEGSTPEVPSYLMLTMERQVPFSIGQLTSCGIDPMRQKILVVKAAIAYRAAYEPVAGTIIEVDTGGTTAVNPKQFTYKRVRRPLYGLE